MSDDQLVNEMLATTHLIDCAEDWQRIADNQTLPWTARRDAQLNADCVYAELEMKRGKR
jgi:hypothetical protein